MISKKLFSFFILFVFTTTLAAQNYPIIKKIKVVGNKQIKKDLILSKIPYKTDKAFDKSKTYAAIENLYALDHFSQIKIETENLTANNIELIITVKEKKLLEKVVIKGNKSIKTKELLEKFNLNNKEAISKEDINYIATGMQYRYKDEGFLFANVTGSLQINKDNPNKAVAHFEIKEGIKTRVRKIIFKGNKKFTDRKLRTMILTKEYWLLGPIFGDGRYIPEMVNIDKNRIEYFYKDHGYLMAKVTDAEAIFSKDNTDITLIFKVKEGDLFKVRKIEAPGDDIFLEEDLLPHIEIEKGKAYPHTKILKTIESLKNLWGDKGYINADVYPQIIPDEDKKEVDITFYADRGNKVTVGRIDITGNEITKDKVIRRKIDIEEGDVITNKKLDRSKDSVELLSYFKPGQVNWRMHRITDETADLELNVREAQTGKFEANINYGSSPHSNKNAVKVGVDLEKRNFMGEGFDIGFHSQIQLAKHGSRWFEFYVEEPHLFDSNVSSRINAFNRNQEFDEWVNVSSTPGIQEYGGSVTLGFVLPKFDKYTAFTFESGLEYIEAKKHNGHKILVTQNDNADLQKIVDNSFKSSTFQWFGLRISKDTRNHLIYPSTGYRFEFNNKLGTPGLNEDYSFIKTEAEMSYYTSLINDDYLILMLYGKYGMVYELNGKLIPYKELFHMGGQNTVRGFKFGQIGPSWFNQDPLGSRNALLFKMELVFPIFPDKSMRAHLFYDAGSGWDTPSRGTNIKSLKDQELLRRNEFNFRQAVGFGFNLLQPQPIKIDWGYKLDRDRASGESPHEFHLSANFAF
ncbi:outer membrane protein assembly factor BamA [Candidatus Babeliales bacterium]|nr:outer membrane protein assembly factor BamA [Candidatus Babeliales bacterium]